MIKGYLRKKSLPRIGKIRLGETVERTNKDGSKMKFPKSVDYFVFPERFLPDIEKKYGTKTPKTIDIVFASDEIEDNMPTWNKQYNMQHVLQCKGNGDTSKNPNDMTEEDFGEIVAGEAPEFSDMICHGSLCPKHIDGKCKAIGNIFIIVLGVEALGVFQIDTGSWNSINNLWSMLSFIKNTTGGRLAGLPLRLNVTMTEVTPEIDGKKKKILVPIMDVVLPICLEDLAGGKLKPLGFAQTLELKVNEIDYDEYDDSVALVHNVNHNTPKAIETQPDIEIDSEPQNSNKMLTKEEYNKLTVEISEYCTKLNLGEKDVEKIKDLVGSNIIDMHRYLKIQVGNIVKSKDTLF